jgi:transposase
VKGDQKLAIPREERIAVMKRIEAGETQTAIAEEYGVSRQYVSILWKAYREKGSEVLLEDRRGRPRTRRLTDSERRHILGMVEAGPPASQGLQGIEVCEEVELWTVEAVRELCLREFGYAPNKGDADKLLKGRGLPVHIGEPTVGRRGFQAEGGAPVPEAREEMDTSEIDDEELARIRRRIEMGQPVLPGRSMPAGPGVRTGKNRGSKAGHRKKKRRKMRR